MKNKYIIRKGQIGDAPFIAETVMSAIGEELCERLGGGKENIPLVRLLFTELAGEENSQYSYKNSLIAVDENNEPAGCIVTYDGELLHELRLAFVNAANRILGWEVTPEQAEKWEDEASEGEIYIDSLYVSPKHRNQKIASNLILSVMQLYKDSDKPVGLLCEPEKKNAYNLYSSLGFEEVGISHFFSTPMLHLQLRQRIP